jgi:hypothetical protein
MIRRRMDENYNPAGTVLFRIVLKVQLLHARIGMPIVTGFFAVAAVLALSQPDRFIVQNGHFIFAALQLGAALIYLAYVLHFYSGLLPLIHN